MSSHLDRKIENFSEWSVGIINKYTLLGEYYKMCVVDRFLADPEKRMQFVQMLLPTLYKSSEKGALIIDRLREWFNYGNAESVSSEIKKELEDYLIKLDKLRSVIEQALIEPDKLEDTAKDLIKLGGYLELFLGE